MTERLSRSASSFPVTTAQERSLRDAEISAAERLGTIGDNKKLRKEFEEHSRNVLRTIATNHREANRALIAAVENAYAAGIRKSVIYKRIGLSSQRLGQIRRQVQNWDKEEETT